MMLTRNGYHSDLRWVNDLGLSKLSPAYSTSGGAMFHVDAIDLLRKLPSNSVDLVITSPPFALTRKRNTATNRSTGILNGSCPSVWKSSAY